MIFLDMDGVCCDFDSGVARLLNKKLPSVWPLGKSVGDVLDTDFEEVREAVERKGEKFWTELHAYPWFKTLYKALEKEADVFFLTSPGPHASAGSGKQRWLNTQFGRYCDNLIVTRHKYLLAKDDAWLVDDSERNIKEFSDAGGKVVLFPQPWNGNETPLNPVDKVLKTVRGEKK